MESFLWALNLFAVCLLCFWALKEDSRPPDNAEADSTPAGKAKAAAARRQKRPLFQRK